jgi:HAD superfamily hydrolase (TIGR01509 family)
VTHDVADGILVIFDCDGVLVDSEPTSNRVMARAIADAGLLMTPSEVAEAFQGMRLRDMQTTVEERLGRALPSSWLQTFERERAAAFERELAPVEGIAEVLRQVVDTGTCFCVASQASTTKMELTLGLTGLSPFFEEERIFSSTMVRHGKPHPDLFLLAAERMGYEPARCAVVEDGVTGVQGARRAGMTVFGYAPQEDGAQRLAAAGAEIFTSMEQLTQLLGVA